MSLKTSYQVGEGLLPLGGTTAVAKGALVARPLLRRADVPEVVCFDKQSDWGGLRNYTWRTGLDELGDPVHGSMYRYRWSNGPKECIEFADYTFDEHFGRPIPSFPQPEVLFDYITGRAKKSNVKQFIQFNTAVRWIFYDEGRDKFDVTVEVLTDRTTRTEEFDYVIVGTGHFSPPNVPDYEGVSRLRAAPRRRRRAGRPGRRSSLWCARWRRRAPPRRR